MALNDIIFVKGEGGLGRPLTGEDFISGLLIYTADGNLPSGFTTAARIKSFGSIADAEKAGIKGDYSDATAGTATYQVTGKANGSTFTVVVTDPITAATTNLGTYTVVSGDSTIAAVATKIAAMINTGTVTTGYSATVSTDTVSIIAPKKFGIAINTGTNIAVTVTGSGAGTLTQFSGGVASKQAIWHYHIAEYFRLQPKGQLYVGFYAVPGSYTFTEIQTIQTFASGKIRQIGVYKDSAGFATADLTAIQSVCFTLDGLHMPLSALYGADLTSVSDLSTLTDLNTLSNPKVSAVISQDGGALGVFLYKTYGKSITNLGALLGAVSYSSVSEDIAWVQKFNISNGTENDVVAFANGTLLTSVSNSLLNQLDNYRYIYLIKYVGIAGSYFNDSHTATIVSSDYAYIENNRTIDKAIRGVYTSLLPSLNSPLVLKGDGTLQDFTVDFFTSQAGVNLTQMVRDSELSAFDVIINSSQNVLSTGNLTVTVKLVPIGVARQITVNIGFTLSI